MFTIGTAKMRFIRVRPKTLEPAQSITLLNATIKRPANIRASELLLSIADENAEVLRPEYRGDQNQRFAFYDLTQTRKYQAGGTITRQVSG